MQIQPFAEYQVVHMPRAVRALYTLLDATLAVQEHNGASTWNWVVCRCLVCRDAGMQVTRPERDTCVIVLETQDVIV